MLFAAASLLISSPQLPSFTADTAASADFRAAMLFASLFAMPAFAADYFFDYFRRLLIFAFSSGFIELFSRRLIQHFAALCHVYAAADAFHFRRLFDAYAEDAATLPPLLIIDAASHITLPLTPLMFWLFCWCYASAAADADDDYAATLPLIFARWYAAAFRRYCHICWYWAVDDSRRFRFRRAFLFRHAIAAATRHAFFAADADAALPWRCHIAFDTPYMRVCWLLLIAWWCFDAAAASDDSADARMLLTRHAEAPPCCMLRFSHIESDTPPWCRALIATRCLRHAAVCYVCHTLYLPLMPIILRFFARATYCLLLLLLLLRYGHYDIIATLPIFATDADWLFLW